MAGAVEEAAFVKRLFRRRLDDAVQGARDRPGSQVVHDDLGFHHQADEDDTGVFEEIPHDPDCSAASASHNQVPRVETRRNFPNPRHRPPDQVDSGLYNHLPEEYALVLEDFHSDPQSRPLRPRRPSGSSSYEDASTSPKAGSSALRRPSGSSSYEDTSRTAPGSRIKTFKSEPLPPGQDAAAPGSRIKFFKSAPPSSENDAPEPLLPPGQDAAAPGSRIKLFKSAPPSSENDAPERLLLPGQDAAAPGSRSKLFKSIPPCEDFDTVGLTAGFFRQLSEPVPVMKEVHTPLAPRLFKSEPLPPGRDAAAPGSRSKFKSAPPSCETDAPGLTAGFFKQINELVPITEEVHVSLGARLIKNEPLPPGRDAAAPGSRSKFKSTPPSCESDAPGLTAGFLRQVSEPVPVTEEVQFSLAARLFKSEPLPPGRDAAAPGSRIKYFKNAPPSFENNAPDSTAGSLRRIIETVPIKAEVHVSLVARLFKSEPSPPGRHAAASGSRNKFKSSPPVCEKDAPDSTDELCRQISEPLPIMKEVHGSLAARLLRQVSAPMPTMNEANGSTAGLAMSDRRGEDESGISDFLYCSEDESGGGLLSRDQLRAACSHSLEHLPLMGRKQAPNTASLDKPREQSDKGVEAPRARRLQRFASVREIEDDDLTPTRTVWEINDDDVTPGRTVLHDPCPPAAQETKRVGRPAQIHRTHEGGYPSQGTLD